MDIYVTRRLVAISISVLCLLVGCSVNNNEHYVNSFSALGAGGSSSFSYSEGIDANGFWEGITATDYVNVDKYQALQIPSEVHRISASAVQDAIDALVVNYSPATQVNNRAIVDGDTVNIDYYVSIDGVEVEGSSTMGNGTYVTIGEESYISGFFEQLIGHIPGETLSIEAVFSEDHPDSNLRGKKAVLPTSINHILEQDLAELTDEFVAANFFTAYGWDSIDEMKKGVRDNLRKDAVSLYIEQTLSLEVAPEAIPDRLITYHKGVLLAEYQSGAEDNAMGFNEYLINSGFNSADELLTENTERIYGMAAYSLAAQAIAETAGISINDDELKTFFAEYFGLNDYSSFETRFGLPFIRQIALYRKVVAHITDNSVLI